jgi:hypothetical protein
LRINKARVEVALEHDQHTLDGWLRLGLLGVEGIGRARAEKQAGPQGGHSLHKIATFHREIPSSSEPLEV